MQQPNTSLLTEKLEKAIPVNLEQGVSLIPFTEELFDQMNEFNSSPSVDGFEYMTENVEQKILKAIGDKKFAYVEAEYFGGEGGQKAIIWHNNKRQKILPFG